MESASHVNEKRILKSVQAIVSMLVSYCSISGNAPPRKSGYNKIIFVTLEGIDVLVGSKYGGTLDLPTMNSLIFAWFAPSVVYLSLFYHLNLAERLADRYFVGVRFSPVFQR